MPGETEENVYLIESANMAQRNRFMIANVKAQGREPLRGEASPWSAGLEPGAQTQKPTSS
jgi:hypothetical protein